MKRLFILIMLVASVWSAARCEFMIERHDGSVTAVSDATVSVSGESFLVGGYPVEEIKRLWHNPVSQSSPGTDISFPKEKVSRVALFDMNSRNLDTEAGYENSRNLYSIEYMAEIAGFPSFTTDNLGEALAGADMLLLSSPVKGGRQPSFAEEEIDALADWVAAGGVLVAPALDSTLDGKLRDLFGVSEIKPYKKNHSFLNWTADRHPELVYFDEPEEREVNICNKLINATEYMPGDNAVSLASYEDGTVAVVKNSVGDGAAYTVGLRWRDVIQRPQLNKDDSSHPSSNVFVPGADIYSLFVRAIYVTAHPVAAWKYTVPDGYDAVLVPTHDCDSSTAYEEMYWMGDYEHSLGLNGHYFLTVHYYRDKGYMSQFYNDVNIGLTKKLMSQGHTVGSHSIGHFPDFSKSERFPLNVVTEEEYALTADHDETTGITTGGSTWAEIVLSKLILERDLGNNVRSFRSGHLCVNKHIPEALSIGDYDFSSCYTAGDVMCSTPFFTRKSNDWTGDLTNVLQMPLHFSDVFSKDKMTEDNWQEKPAIWYDIFNKLRGNYMSSIILIHPNRKWKMEAEKMLVEMMDLSGSGLYNFQDYGDFWIGRHNFEFDYVYLADEEKVIVRASAADIARNPSLGIMIEASAPVSDITLVDETGTVRPGRVTTPAPGKYLLLFH